MIKRGCEVSDCARTTVARGMCTMHYQRFIKHGSTADPVRPPQRHGEKRRGRTSPEYRVWQRMRNSCNNPNSHDYSYYGGRGIRVCAEWDASFDVFLRYAGRRPTPMHTLDRVNNDGNYEPGNVRWATRAEQSRNRRPFSMKGRSPLRKCIEADGIVDSIAGWARRLGVAREVVRGRLKRGWDPVRAVTEPAFTTPSGPKRKAS